MIDKAQFADEFAELAFDAGIRDTCALEFPEYMYERNEESPRSFAEVDPEALYFAFAPQVLELSWQHRRGLIMHELGHVLCHHLPNGGTERDADLAAERTFGERIIYDKSWPGKGLQCVQCSPRANPAAPIDVAERFRAVVTEPAAQGRWPIKADRISAALDDITIGYEQGEIRNIVYKDAKDLLGRALELSWGAIRDEYVTGRGDSAEGALAGDFSFNSLHDAISAKKKLDKIKAKPDKALSQYSHYTFNDVDPVMVGKAERLIEAAYPLALMVKEMKGMIVKGRAPSAGPTKAQKLEIARASDPRLKTCAVCFNDFITTKGSPMRHGFEVVTKGRGMGLHGAWHTGPCMGFHYPHYGLSTEGTKAALKQAQARLDVVECFLERLKTYPPLQWKFEPSRYEQSQGETARLVTVERFKPRLGVPSYDTLYARKKAESEGERSRLLDAIAFYKDKIATWRPES